MCLGIASIHDIHKVLLFHSKFKFISTTPGLGSCVLLQYSICMMLGSKGILPPRRFHFQDEMLNIWNFHSSFERQNHTDQHC